MVLQDWKLATRVVSWVAVVIRRRLKQQRGGQGRSTCGWLAAEVTGAPLRCGVLPAPLPHVAVVVVHEAWWCMKH